jgi:hypothetical protein
VRRDDHALEPEQRRLRGRLLGEHVERGAAEPSVLERLRERLLVHDAAARRVDQPRALLAERELSLADQPLRVRRAREVDRDEVGLHEERLERRHELDAHLLGAVLRDVRVERDDPHPEPRRAPGDERAHAPDPDDPERLALQLDALPLGSLPLAGLERSVGLGDVPRLREHERERVLGGRDDVRLRRVDDHHASTRGGLDVDVVEPDPRARDHLQVLARLDHVRRDLGLRAHDERVVRRDDADEVAGRELGADVDLEVTPEQVEPRLRQRFGDEDAHQPACANTSSAAATAAPRLTG